MTFLQILTRTDMPSDFSFQAVARFPFKTNLLRKHDNFALVHFSFAKKKKRLSLIYRL